MADREQPDREFFPIEAAAIRRYCHDKQRQQYAEYDGDKYDQSVPDGEDHEPAPLGSNRFTLTTNQPATQLM